MSSPTHPASSGPVYAHFSSERLTIGAGVAIFHIQSARVVLCYHTRDRYWFLPKGRRDVNERTETGAEREGFEESGYRNRLLPLPISHRQPAAHNPIPEERSKSGENGRIDFVVEPIWTELLPFTRTRQYLLFWYISETLPQDVEDEINHQTKALAETSDSAKEHFPYIRPPPYPKNMSLRERVSLDDIGSGGYEPKRHANTGVDEEELMYHSELVPVAEATKKLGRSITADVVRKGWELIQLRMRMEKGTETKDDEARSRKCRSKEFEERQMG